VLVDVTPASAGYSVEVTPTGDEWLIQVTQGGPLRVSANQTLSFAVSAAGAVSGSVSVSVPSPAPSPVPSPIPPAISMTPPEPDPAPVPVPTLVPTGPAQTLTFTQGVDAYGGVTDASISDLGYSSSGNSTGAVYATNDTLYTYALDYTTKALIRFDVSRIPAAATVVSASLDLTLESWTAPQTLIGSFLTMPWNEGAASFGWTSTGAGSTWTIPGIGPNDLSGPAFELPGIDASGYQRKSIAIDAASVGSWVRDPAANRGLLLANRDSGKILRICSSEASNPARRPTLSVTYR
jgi:hypothetical protein